MTELPRPGCNHVGSIRELLELRLEQVAGTDLFLFVLPDRQGRDELLASSTVNEQKVFLADLHAELLLRVIKLADSSAFGEGAEGELGRMRAGEFNNLQPGDVVCGVVRVASSTLVVRRNNFGRRIETSLKALDQDRTKRPCAEVGGQRLVPVQNTGVGGQQREQVRQGVVFADQRQVFGKLAGEIIYAELVGA